MRKGKNMKILKRIHNHKIDIFGVIKASIIVIILFVTLWYYQDIYYERGLSGFTGPAKNGSYFMFSILCWAGVYLLSFFIPILKYLFFKNPKVKNGIVKSVKSKSKGLLHYKYIFVVTIESEGKEYISDKIIAYMSTDASINYGDVEEIWKGKKVYFHNVLFSKNKVLIKKIF